MIFFLLLLQSGEHFCIYKAYKLNNLYQDVYGSFLAK